MFLKALIVDRRKLYEELSKSLVAALILHHYKMPKGKGQFKPGHIPIIMCWSHPPDSVADTTLVLVHLTVFIGRDVLTVRLCT